MNLQPLVIQGYSSGLETNKKPFALTETAFPKLENAYCWRERIKKREGMKLLGRLRRFFFNDSIGNSAASPWTFNIYSTLTSPITPETNAEIEPGSVIIYIGASTTTAAITGYTNASDCEVTSALHGLSTGDQVEITGVVVVEGSGPDDINGKIYTIEVITVNTFKLGVSSQSWGIYSSGGTWTHPVAANQTLFDQGDGTLATSPASATTGIINYLTGSVTLTGATAGVAATITFGYFPGLPVMGILTRELSSINNEQTVFFDTVYAYVHDGNNFVEMTPGTIWAGTDSDFFWGTNYRGSEAQDRLFFVTNFVNSTTNPMRYFVNSAWTDFAPLIGSEPTNQVFADFAGGAGPYNGVITGPPTEPLVPGTVAITVEGEEITPIVFRDTPKDGTLVASGLNTGTINYATGAFVLNFNPALAAATYKVFATYNLGSQNLFQARILIPYYGRLLALNVWEGESVATANNIFNRCRFSQVGSPIQVDAWRSDTFGKGGFIDAPINEEITSAIFYKNTLIVFFERSTWQLRYVGEYGLPFVWERISSDFGGESPFSTILFDDGVLAVGDRAIVSSTGNNVQRIDLQIPDTVFNFNNLENGPLRIQGIRDYQKEVVYWCYSDGTDQSKFPNYSLVYNYRNGTYATFRNNVTAYGVLKSPGTITWDSQTVTWDSTDVTWDDDVIKNFPLIVSGNQHGYTHFYGYADPEVQADSSINALDQESLFITAVDLSTTPPRITVPNHNLKTGEIIYVVGMSFVNASGAPLATTLNDKFYQVNRVSANVLGILQWSDSDQSNIDNFTFTPVSAGTTYIGGGQLALFPVLNIRTKDFNPFDKQGISSKLAYVDFLIDAQTNSYVTVKLFVNSSLEFNANQNMYIGSKMGLAPTGFGQITAATQANPTVITTLQPHDLKSGDQIVISGVVGMTSGALNINGIYNITYVSSTQFSLDGSNTTAYTAYTSGGQYIQLNYPFYVPESNYEWHRYYAGCSGQYIAVNMTYDNALMNNINTHQQLFVLNSMKLWVKSGSRSIF